MSYIWKKKLVWLKKSNLLCISFYISRRESHLFLCCTSWQKTWEDLTFWKGLRSIIEMLRLLMHAKKKGEWIEFISQIKKEEKSTFFSKNSSFSDVRFIHAKENLHYLLNYRFFLQMMNETLPNVLLLPYSSFLLCSLCK